MSEQITILLVDDDPSFAKLIELYLSQNNALGFSLTSKSNVNDALQWINQGNPCDIIILDYYMPELKGDALAQALIEEGKLLPIIYITINKDFRLAVEAMKLGINDFLVKDEINPQVLMRTITNAIERHKLHQEFTSLEISSTRLEAIHELVMSISKDLLGPLEVMQATIHEVEQKELFQEYQAYIKIISSNIQRIAAKIEKLKTLNDDTTISYVSNIRMFDLS